MSGGSFRTEREFESIVTYSNGQWKHRGSCHPIFAVTGGACLVFGFARESTVVSDPIDHFYFVGTVLSTNGVAIANYSEHQNT